MKLLFASPLSVFFFGDLFFFPFPVCPRNLQSAPPISAAALPSRTATQISLLAIESPSFPFPFPFRPAKRRSKPRKHGLYIPQWGCDGRRVHNKGAGVRAKGFDKLGQCRSCCDMKPRPCERTPRGRKAEGMDSVNGRRRGNGCTRTINECSRRKYEGAL